MSPAKKKDKAPAIPGSGAVSAAQKARSAGAKAAIFKRTKQKPIEEQDGVYGHVDSGSTLLNATISGASVTAGLELRCPGYPRRHITEIYGPESSGKTTVALAAIATCQKNGGMAMFLDAEHALDHRYARACGVRFDESLMLYQPDTLEQAFQMVLVALVAGVDLVVVDSVAALVPEDELKKGVAETAKIGIVAAKMAQTLPKLALWLSKYPDPVKNPGHPGTAIILLNQERSKISTGGGKGGGDNDPNTSGGKALKFFTYLRLRFQKIKSEYVKRKDPITGKERGFPFGNLTRAKVVKTKIVGNQGDDILIFIRYGFGLDDIYSLIEVGVHQRLIGRDGAYYSWEGQRFQGKDKLRAYLLSNKDALDKLKKVITQVVMNATTPVKEEDLSPEDEFSEALDSEMPDDDGEEEGNLDEEEIIETDDPLAEDGEEVLVE